MPLETVAHRRSPKTAAFPKSSVHPVEFLLTILISYLKEIGPMDICNTKFSAANVLSEEVARQVFEALPEHGVVVVLVAPDGTCRQSDSEEFARFGLDAAAVAELRARVDDGAEPVTARVGDATIAMAQLTGERTNLGYVIVAAPRCGAKPGVSDIALLEALLDQISLVARLVERNGLLVETQIGHVRALVASQSSLN